MNKYKLIILVVLSLFISGNIFAAELTTEQKRFRTSLQEFLKEEGFMPTIDEEDNSLNFKKEGTLYWFTFGGSNPLYIEFHRSGLKCEDADKALVLQAVNAANRKVRCAKAMFNDTSISFAIEMYCHSAEEFKYIFYKCMKELESIKDEVSEFYNGGSTGTGNSSASNSQPSYVSSPAINKFFPVYGCLLGKVTVRDMEAKGYAVKTISSGDHYCDVRSLTFWDHDKDNVFEDIYITHSDALPEKWEDGLGLSWKMSYNQLLSFFRNLGFSINVDKAPHTKEYSGRKTLSADVTATSADGHLIFDLDFDYGNGNGEGYSTSSANSLYSMTIKVK